MEKRSIHVGDHGRMIDPALEKYYCTKCKRIHHKFFGSKKTKIFEDHIAFAKSLTWIESFKLDFKRKWRRLAKEMKDE